MIIHWNTEKLNRYLFRIDGAILKGRYHLALKLTNRLLKQYYKSLLLTKLPEHPKSNDVRSMSNSICRYLLKYYKKYKIPHWDRRIFLISLVSNVVFIYMMHTSKSGEEQIIDKATAIYMREKVNYIILFLMKYL